MYTVYQIMPGDTLEEIASKFNTTVDTLMQINSLDTNRLTPGMGIVVPKSNQDLTYYIVRPGDTIYGIARKANVDPETLLALNGLDSNDYIYPNQQLLIPDSNTKVYVTKGDETLSDVAGNLGVSVETILSQNQKLYLSPDQMIVYKKEKTF